jgi:hypothetical protein
MPPFSRYVTGTRRDYKTVSAPPRESPISLAEKIVQAIFKIQMHLHGVRWLVTPFAPCRNFTHLSWGERRRLPPLQVWREIQPSRWG